MTGGGHHHTRLQDELPFICVGCVYVFHDGLSNNLCSLGKVPEFCRSRVGEEGTNPILNIQIRRMSP